MNEQELQEQLDDEAAYSDLLSNIVDAQDATTSALTLLKQLADNREYWDLTDAQRSLITGARQFIQSAHESLHAQA